MAEEIIQRAIERRAGDGSDPRLVADAVSEALERLYVELAIVVGAQAAAALCAHAVHRTRASVRWTMPPAAVFSHSTLSALRDDLSTRTSEMAFRAGQALLSALVEHLVSLIGRPLTHRMLDAAWSLPDASPDNPGEFVND